jgi:hypothetical protein
MSIRIPLTSSAAKEANQDFVEISEVNLSEDAGQLIKMLTFEKVSI